MFSETALQLKFSVEPTDIHYRLLERDYSFYERPRDYRWNCRNSGVTVSGMRITTVINVYHIQFKTNNMIII